MFSLNVVKCKDILLDGMWYSLFFFLYEHCLVTEKSWLGSLLNVEVNIAADKNFIKMLFWFRRFYKAKYEAIVTLLLASSSSAAPPGSRKDTWSFSFSDSTMK